MSSPLHRRASSSAPLGSDFGPAHHEPYPALPHPAYTGLFRQNPEAARLHALETAVVDEESDFDG
ncbi:uncharacterized protein ANIA_10162 [Aspergillus nidulans FGSC A4]|uniref:Uncharacterized protein n=1 Tax=Emericella nidulans (strain FGSC A4 / ATCC 38163 / CBS 112.46 / NRRL 194 / M139) TaxID=227321 RepID=C8VTM4_EMENI|nr:hypothetical protein [Aspergillus nidulans FGSC A4]CBF88190.1 TPA: hypothetical protein ANIA_10162 [Aspergillus nidulans FGSC A4]